MRQALAIARFEFVNRLRRLSSWVYFAIFLALSFFWVLAFGGAFPGADVALGGSRLAVNSPYAVAQLCLAFAPFAMIVAAALMARAVEEDVAYNTAAFFATAPISRVAYLLGRFAGAYGVLLLILLSLPSGAYLGSLWPRLDASRLLPNHWGTYALPYLYFCAVDGFIIGVVFFFVAALTRRMLPVYIGIVLVVIGWLVSRVWLQNLDARTLSALVDPFGARAFSLVTAYWTAPERNANLLPTGGLLLENRLLWLAAAAAVAVLGAWRFSFAAFVAPGAGAAAAAPLQRTAAHARPQAVRGRRPASILRLAWFYLRGILLNVYFGVLVLAGLAFAVVLTFAGGRIYGTPTWPVTFHLLDLLAQPFALFILAIVTFYAGELVWRERDANLDQIIDAAPIATARLLIAKFLALMAVPLILECIILLAGIALQIEQLYFHIELGLWLHELIGIQLVDMWLICALAFAVQVVVNQKYLGHFLMILYFIVLTGLSALGFEDRLYKFGETGDVTYSDMNGFGHGLVSTRLFQAYWGAASVLLLVLAYLLMVRGRSTTWAERRASARRRFAGAVPGLAGAAAAAFVGLGGWNYYASHVLNVDLPQAAQERLMTDYERMYRPLLAQPQPKITAVLLAIDLDPKRRSGQASGSYTLTNKTSTPITFVNVDFPAGNGVFTRALNASRPYTLVIDDARLGFRQLRLATPLLPGDSFTLQFTTALESRGFGVAGEQTAIVANGTFFNGRVLLPHVGYDIQGELSNAADRKKMGLPPRAPMRAQDDPQGLAVNYIADDADTVTFRVDLSTEPGQLAVAPGLLIEHALRAGRDHFVYQASRPILNFYAFQSARYAVKRDVWHSPSGDIPLEIDYQPGHEFDLERMLAGARDALSYNSSHFAPYQYPAFRIVEFPRYQSFAESFPNTTPYSEALGFIARVNPADADGIDYPYFVTAHEVAHQWWGYQMVGADVVGATFLSETLAQYSAMMVLKHRDGDARMRRFLRYELDTYLKGRASEGRAEVPLEKVEDQTYIHYAKGALAMYALQDALGEDVVDRDIQDMLRAHAQGGAPYPVSTELVERFKASAPDALKPFVSDLFERIVLFDNRALSAHATPLPHGGYRVAVTVAAAKIEADGAGNDHAAALDDWIDVGLLDRAGNAIALRKVHFGPAVQTLDFDVETLPARAGIDPLHKLIDRTLERNTVAVALDGAG